MQELAATHTEIYLSVVVPCFNEEEGLNELVRRVVAVCDILDRPWELVLIDDGSSDDTWRIIESHASENTSIHGVCLSRNYGHQLALTAGLSVARGARICMIDADLQDPPEVLPAMLERMDLGFDIVYGQRSAREGETLFKKLTARIFYRLIRSLSDTEIPVDTGDFRLVSRRALDDFMGMTERYRFVRGMFSWIGYRQSAFEYRRDARFAGETKYPLTKMVRFALDALTGFSIMPLKLATTLAYLSLVVSAVIGVYVVASLIMYQTAPGWASLLLAISFFSSMQLLTQGIMGEYIGRLYMESKGRPLFIIREHTPLRPDDTSAAIAD
jgi:dolichol-phosphate mannosyltransferase